MKKLVISIGVILVMATLCFAQGKSLLLDDFEGVISGGANGTVDFGVGNGSSVSVAPSKDVTYAGKQSLKITFDAVSGGYMWIARGFGLDAQNAGWMVKPENIDWPNYNAISFNLRGDNSKAKIAFDIKDSGNEIWRFVIDDDFTGWREITCPFDKFMVRSDWQPDNADNNFEINFPLRSYQFEPLPESKGVIYVDDVELVKK